jgi:hypothetical protein
MQHRVPRESVAVHAEREGEAVEAELALRAPEQLRQDLLVDAARAGTDRARERDGGFENRHGFTSGIASKKRQRDRNGRG